MNNYPNILPNVQSCPSSANTSTTSDSYKNLSTSQYTSMQSSLTINDGSNCNNVTPSLFYSDKYAQYLAKKKSPNLRKC